MQKLIKINGEKIDVKVINGKRVVTTRDIDRIHLRASGTARRAFRDNKKHFIEGEDYFLLTDMNIDTLLEGGKRPRHIPPTGILFFTEPGYLMLVKSLTDKLAWKIQRELVDFYFRAKERITKVPTVPKQPIQKQVVLRADIPDNLEAQRAMTELRSLLTALKENIKISDRYIEYEKVGCYQELIAALGVEIWSKAYNLSKIKINPIQKDW